MKRIFLIALALISGICSAQTFTVNNLSVNGTSSHTGAATFSIRPTFNGNTPWDSGNLTPGNYALLGGATFTGPVTIPFGASLPLADDIRNFGAVCNSSGSQVANNTAISNALSARGTAYIPECAIYVSNITLSSGQRLWGSGNNSNLIAFGSLSAAGLVNCTGCTGFDVDNVDISVNATQRAAGVSGITCTSCNIVSIFNNVVQGNYGIAVAGSFNVSIQNNLITAYGEASSTNGSGDGIAVQGTALDGNGYNCGGTGSQNGIVSGNIIQGAASASNPPTPFGINICGASFIAVTGNRLLNPGYFGIVMRGSGATNNVVGHNVISNSVHEGIINVGAASNNVIEGNSITAGGSSIDYCLTLDGSQGTITAVAVKNNTLNNCYLSGIEIFDSVQFSSIVGNTIYNPNTSGTAAQSGIAVVGAGNSYNQIAANTITASSITTGWGILETTGGTGTPSHNVFMSNSTLNMSTGNFSIQGTSANNNNIAYP